MEDPLFASLQKSRGAFVRTSILLFLQSLTIAASPVLVMEFVNRLQLASVTAASELVTAHPSPIIPEVFLKSAHESGFQGLSAEALVLACGLAFLALFGAWLARLEETQPLASALEAVRTWRHDLLEKLLRGKLSYFENHSPSELASRLSDDSIIVEALLVSSLRAFAKAFPLLLLMMAALAFQSVILACAFAFAMIPFYSVAAAFVRADWVRSKRSDVETGYYRQEIEHVLHLLPSLKSLSAEAEALEGLDIRADRSDEQILLSRKARGSLSATIVAAKHILRAGLIVFGAVMFANGFAPLGTLVLFAIYIELMPTSVIDLARCVALARTAAPALERLRSLAVSLDHEEETEGAQNTSSLPFPDADVLRFENVLLNQKSQPLSAEFEPGELIAVVGTASSGRTTFGRMLNRLSEPEAGKILIGKTELKRFRLGLLRNTVAVVDRKPFFATTSIRENLGFAAEKQADLEDRKISAALHSAGVDFINDLPEKLETVIGETAYRLDDSQAARLSLARAFLRTEAKIYYFDEPTLALETEEARDVFESVQRIAEDGALVFWVTRRLDEASESDRVLFFERHGSAADAEAPITITLDTHESLMERSDSYRRTLGLRDRKSSTVAAGNSGSGSTPAPSTGQKRSEVPHPEISV
jgi:ATP-binding cassette, subfamily B, bacterial